MSSLDVDPQLHAELLRRMLDARLLRHIVVASPSVGAEWTQTPGAASYWELVAVRAVFTTSAVVATRFPGLRGLDSDSREVWRVPPHSSAAASTAVTLSWTAGLGYSNGNLGLCAALPTPPLVIYPGLSLASLTVSLDAGDQWSGIVVTVREYSPDRLRLQADWINR